VGRVPATGDLFDDAAPTLVATTELAPADAREAWSAAGAEVEVFEPEGRFVPLQALMGHLGKRDVQAVLLEGGPTLAWSAVEEGLVDRVVPRASSKARRPRCSADEASRRSRGRCSSGSIRRSVWGRT
jgi:diaminohydroxyphosphoribosylaminopyrimidine deaminase/5-amino-6-(5-phosphoribosylamino)uracil reductase